MPNYYGFDAPSLSPTVSRYPYSLLTGGTQDVASAQISLRVSLPKMRKNRRMFGSGEGIVSPYLGVCSDLGRDSRDHDQNSTN